MPPGTGEDTKISVNIRPDDLDFLAILCEISWAKGVSTQIKLPIGSFVPPIGISFDVTISPAEHAAMEKLVPHPNQLLAYFKQLVLDQLNPILRQGFKAYI